MSHFSGIFTLPVSGTWRISYFLGSAVDSYKFNSARLFFHGIGNYGNSLDESGHYTESVNGGGTVSTTGGRVVNLEASARDNIYIRAGTMGGHFYDIYFCAEFIPTRSN